MSNYDPSESRLLRSTLMSRRGFATALTGTLGMIATSGLLVSCISESDGNSTQGGETDSGQIGSDNSEADEPNDDETPIPGSDELDEARIVVGIQELPPGLEPIINEGNLGVRVTYSIYDFLLRRDFRNGVPPGTGNELQPMLAESWEWIDDVTIELTLRQDAFFHNGQQFTANDVKYSFDRLLVDPKEDLVSGARFLNTIESVDVVEEFTVRISTEAPDPLLTSRLASYGSWIVPNDYLESVSIADFNQSPVGTGPYVVTEFAPDNQLVLEASHDYWGDHPNVDNVEFRVIPEVAGRIAALVSGEADIITNLPPDQIQPLETDPNVELRSVPLSNVHILVFNTAHPQTADKLLRQALRLGIDRELLIDTLWSGRAVHTRSLQLEEFGPLFDADRPLTEYDPERARSLVEESSYDGETIGYWLSPGYYTLGLDAAQAIVEMWADIGINAQIVAREDLSSIDSEEIAVRNVSNTSFHGDPDSFMRVAWGGDSWIQANFWEPENLRFNDIAEAAARTLDFDERAGMYRELLDIWEEESPGTVLYAPMETYAMRANVDWTPYSFWYMDLRADNLTLD